MSSVQPYCCSAGLQGSRAIVFRVLRIVLRQELLDPVVLCLRDDAVRSR
jgi:hypothetical protein